MAGQEGREPPGDAAFSPRLTPHQEEQAQEVSSIIAPVIHETIRRQGDEELARPVASLAWSGLAAGLSMGFSLITEGILMAGLPPDAPWTPLVVKLGYPIGFLIVILGRQQLFTENTLTAVLPVLARRDLRTLGKMLRLWGIVLAANLAGALAIAWVLRGTPAFDPPVRERFVAIAREAVVHPFGTILLRGIFAGWIIALVVWLLPAARPASFWIISSLTWLIAAGGFSHVVAGAVEAFHLAVTGAIGWTRCLGGYLLPALIGNVLGGVSLVAALNHAQVVAGKAGRAPAGR